jgi:hypothetical protein
MIVFVVAVCVALVCFCFSLILELLYFCVKTKLHTHTHTSILAFVHSYCKVPTTTNHPNIHWHWLNATLGLVVTLSTVGATMCRWTLHPVGIPCAFHGTGSDFRSSRDERA